MKFGYEGLGLFYTLLEKLAKQEKPIKTVVLKKQLNIGKRLEKVWDFMEKIQIISSLNGETFNENILNFSEKYQIKKEKTRKKISEWREKQKDVKNVTGYEMVSNPPKVKESKVNEKKVFIRPDLKDVIQYFLDNGYVEDIAKKAFNYYDIAGWVDSKGCKIKNWKQKMQGVWFKDENKKINKEIIPTPKTRPDMYMEYSEYKEIK